MAEDDSGSEESEIKKYGMFKAVFTPTLLTILGVILFLRLGYVVGSVGLLGAIIIIIISFLITACTALSMSSIVTNIKIGSGGAYSIISRSMGLEIGGSIGVPLYLSLALSIVMYVFGFREGLQMVLPGISPILIDFVTFGTVFLIVFMSTESAFKVQYGILVAIIVSIVAILAAGLPTTSSFDFHQPPDGGSFWLIFAIFFPASTGIMAGANMSGELKNPKKAIPIGTLAAIAVSLGVYLLLAYWLAGSASGSELVNNFTILIDVAVWGPIVLIGLLAATFSSALNSVVGASRILQAMGENNILPGSGWFSKRSEGGIPRNAMLITGLIAVGSILLRDLNTIAPIITMFFLITYAMLNIVILIEQSLGLVSFRPLLKIPRIVALAGAVGCVFAMFIINPTFSLVAAVIVVGFYYLLMHRHLKTSSPYGDVRSSLFIALAEWAANKARSLPRSYERAWKPYLMVPIRRISELKGISMLIRDITFPRGALNILGIEGQESGVDSNSLDSATRGFKEEGVFADYTLVDSGEWKDNAIASIERIRESFYTPNIVLLRMPDNREQEEDYRRVITKATEHEVAIMLYADHSQAGLGRKRTINLWIPEKCLHWGTSLRLPNCDLELLIAYKLKLNWNAKINLIAMVEEEERIEQTYEDLEELLDVTRIPINNIKVTAQNMEDYMGQAPRADLNIFNLPPDPDFDRIRWMVEKSRSSCLLCRDSGKESALA